MISRSNKRKPILQSKRIVFLKNYDFKCVNCGSQDSVDIHHIIPLEYGGYDIESNMTVLCEECHRKYHNGKSMRGRSPEARLKRKTLKNGRRAGRCTELTDEEAEFYFWKYIQGKMSTEEVRNIKGLARFTASTQFARFKHKHKIRRVNNCAATDKISYLSKVWYENGAVRIFKRDGTVAWE